MLDNRIWILLCFTILVFASCEDDPDHSTPQQLGYTMLHTIQDRDVEGFIKLGVNKYALEALAFAKIKDEAERQAFLEMMEIDEAKDFTVGNVSEWKINNIIGFGHLKKFNWKQVKVHEFALKKDEVPGGIEMYTGHIKLVSNKKRYMFRMRKMIKMLDGQWYIWKVNMGNYWPKERRR
jgi:hypothetical protein